MEGLDKVFSDIKEHARKAVELHEIVKDALFNPQFMDVIMLYQGDDQFIKYCGKRWEQRIGKPSREISTTPVKELLFDDKWKKWTLSQLSSRTPPQRAYNDPCMINKWYGVDGPFYVKWYGARAIPNHEEFLFWAEETNEKEYLDFIAAYGE